MAEVGGKQEDIRAFRHWVITRRDMRIRVRLSDGSEIDGLLSDAVREARSSESNPDEPGIIDDCIDLLTDPKAGAQSEQEPLGMDE